MGESTNNNFLDPHPLRTTWECRCVVAVRNFDVQVHKVVRVQSIGCGTLPHVENGCERSFHHSHGVSLGDEIWGPLPVFAITENFWLLLSSRELLLRKRFPHSYSQYNNCYARWQAARCRASSTLRRKCLRLLDGMCTDR